MTPYLLSAPVRQVSDTPWAQVRVPALCGVALVALCLGGAGFWSARAPLASAAVASGVVAVETSRKTVQHFEGGIIGAILIKEGDAVTAGQPLLQLDNTRARTTLAALNGQLWDAEAAEARLSAEQERKDLIRFPADLVAAAALDESAAQIMIGQTQLMNTRIALRATQADLIRQRINQTREEIVGLKSQGDVATQQKSLVAEELAMIRQLFDKGLEKKSHMLQLQGGLADTEGKRATAMAQTARAEQTIIESQVSLLNLQNEAQKEVADELRDTRKQIHELREKIQNATDIMTRTIVRAPEAGIVTDLRVHTAGGVVNAGDPLLDLVPPQDRMIVEAQVRPEDIAVVRPGLKAQVRLLPYKQRRTRPLQGEVTYISADRLIDKNSNHPYYAAKIRIEDDDLSSSGLDMRPGMPSEVMIQTGESTVAMYALAPLLDSFHRAFKEE